MRGNDHTTAGSTAAPSDRSGGLVPTGRSDRGVSEVLGFALTLAIVVGSVALVFGVGLGALEDVNQSQQDENAEGAFVHLANRFAELGADAAPYRAGEFSVAPGRVGVRDVGTLEVEVATNASTHAETFTLRSLAYTREDTRIAFEGGGLFRSDRGGVVTRSAPPLDCTAERALLTVTTLNATDATSRSADVVTISGRHDQTTLWYPFDRVGNANASAATSVTVDISSPNEVAWRRTLDEADGWTDPDGDGAYTCTTGRVYVRHVRIDVTLV
ncbi:hypothetical protein N0B31_20695 [Salinirubellus salinus]|uniref:Uncharacterized protein n=1 Tax=Salinirubellus salinus TaxID=1364945 RepID=A0A9E7UAY6_9EURY|nr:hypothetical protein [Salinirubellus salinus]UWM54527.1 hypothetical protein N0B31_20695 [Salinirubellus salinus]